MNRFLQAALGLGFTFLLLPPVVAHPQDQFTESLIPGCFDRKTRARLLSYCLRHMVIITDCGSIQMIRGV